MLTILHVKPKQLTFFFMDLNHYTTKKRCHRLRNWTPLLGTGVR